jgi:cysteine-rich repeat protein
MDLPPGDCVATLIVYRGGAVVCDGSEAFTVIEGGSTKLDINLFCSLSVDLGDGTGDTGGAFQFNVGNQCPKIFSFSAQPNVVPKGQSSTLIQTLALDLDGTCGNNCDPQTCDTANPPNCTPGPDNGFATQLDAFVGTFDDPTASLTTYHCDPYFPGPIEICVNATDGDLDCDKNQCIAVVCPDPCEGVVCGDGNECTAESCDPQTGTCVFEVAPDGIACDSCNSTCQAGVCDPATPFTAIQNAQSMPFTGSIQSVTTTLINPYSGHSVPVSGNFNVNISSYKGVGTMDEIVGTSNADMLFVHTPLGTQRVCGVEFILSENNLDVLFLADKFIVLQDMTLLGGNSGDILWGNAGNDVILGNNGRDIIDGGPGDDTISGGNGKDLITWWPGAGSDLVWGGGSAELDTVQVKALLSQIEILPAPNPVYEFGVYYLGNLAMQLLDVEFLVALNGSIDLTLCAAGVCNLCGNDDLNGGEECDDGNLTNGDGCASDCTVE